MSPLERQLQAVASLSQAGRHTEAVAKLRPLQRAHPGSFEVHTWLACELAYLKQFDQAEFAAARAMALRPDVPAAAMTLANILIEREDLAKAAEVLAASHARSPAHLETSLGLLAILDRLQRNDRIVEIARACIERGHDDVETHVFLGVSTFELGRPNEAGAVMDRAAAKYPDYERLLSLRAAIALYRDDLTPQQVAAAARDYGLALERTIAVDAAAPAPSATPREGRRTRIGFISADFRRHACAHFYAGLFPGIDRSKYEVRVYHQSPAEDEVTDVLRGHVDALVNTSGLTPEQLLARLRDDALDVLIEGSGHTFGQALPVLHRRAAPVQASWMGYPGSTGVRAIDWRMSDAVVDPPERDGEFVERPMRIEGCGLAFHPIGEWPDATAVTRQEDTGALTFGSFNAIKKLSPSTVALWSQLLRATPGARLLLIGRGLETEAARAGLAARFVECGVEAARLDIRPPVATAAELRTHYRLIDVALDPYPYHGTTTTCESLMLGVPVLTLQGQTHAARVGGSLLGAVGLSEFACRTREEFQARGLELSSPAGRARLAEIRRDLPGRFRATLGDAAGFARRFEAAIERMLAER